MLNNRKLNVLEELENLRNENVAVKRAVESKSAAIAILRTELEECQKERDEFRMMAENHPVSRPLASYKVIQPCPERTHSAMLGGSENTLAQLLSQSKEENKSLRLELTELRCRLHDAQSDLKILRAEKSRKIDFHNCRLSVTTSSQLAQQERESLIQQLEQLSSKCQVQETDLRCLLEEREELIKERDDIRHKSHRLNHVVNVLLSRDALKTSRHVRHRIVNLDAIIAENRYLQQRMKQLDEEKCLALANSSKYKSALESCRSRPNSNSLKLGNSENLIMSPKQVGEFLKQYDIEIGEHKERDLRFLCAALLDALNQKSRVVKTQKAANKMLVERINDLERRLVPRDDDDMSTTITLVSASLMEGYNPSSAVSTIEILDMDNLINEIDTEQSVKIDGSNIETVKSSCVTTEGDVECEGVEDVESEMKEEEFEEEKNELQSIEEQTEYSNSDSEEIVPLEKLDVYISKLKQKRKEKDDPKEISEENRPVDSSPQSSPIKRTQSSDTSFEIDISDYESDDDNFEKTLQNWQNECEKNSSNQNIIKKLSPKRSVTGILKSKKQWKEKKIEFPEKLQQLLN